MTDTAPDAPQEKTPWYQKRSTAVWGLLIVGPFALPILWYCRGFSRKAKIAITLLVVVLTYLSYRYTPVLLDRLTQQAGELQTLAKS